MPGEVDKEKGLRSTEERSVVPTRGPAERSVVVELSPDLTAALRPWVDLDEVGGAGFQVWLRSILPLIPRPHSDTGKANPSGPATRVLELAVALAECSGDRARVHFQASQYFRENQMLARRVRSLEAMLRTARRGRAGGEPLASDPEAELALERYLPPSRKE